MTGAVVGALRAILSLESAAFTQGLQAARTATQRFGKQMDAIGRQMQKAGTIMSAAMTAPLAGMAVAVQQANKAFAQLGNQSRTAGMAAQDFKVLAIASEQFGVQQDQLAGILKDVNEKMGEAIATGGGPLIDFFEQVAPKVGITTEAFKGLNAADALQLYISSLEKAGLNQQQMTFYMEQLASESTALLPVFANQGAALAEVRAEAERLGLSIDQDLVDGAGDIARQFNIVREVLAVEVQEALVRLAPAFQQMIRTVVPIIEQLVTTIGDVAQKFSDLDAATQGMIGWGVAIAAAFGPVLFAVGLTVAAIGKVTTALATMAAAALANPFLLVAGLIAGAAVLIWWNWDWLKGKMAEIWDSISQKASEAWTYIKTTIGEAIDWVAAKWDAFVNKIEAAIQIAKDAAAAIGDAIRAAPGEGATENPGANGEGFDGFVRPEKMRFQGEVGGKALGDGITAGLTQSMQQNLAVITAALNTPATVLDQIMKIASPSKVMREKGQFIGEGLALGIKDGAPDVAAAMGEVGNALEGQADSLASRLEAFRSTMKSAFVGLVTGANSFREALAQVARKLADMLAEAAFNQIFGGLFKGGGLLASIFNGIFADGGVFQGGRVTAFASGGVISTPTVFPMVGGLGLMGEAGPEAIMPLTRGPGGRLGVEAIGGGRGAQEVILRIAENDMFAARVEAISEGSAVRIVRTYDREIAPTSRKRGPREVG